MTTTIKRTIPAEWTSGNIHMGEGYYGILWADAADVILRQIGVDEHYHSTGFAFFTVETNTKFLAECHAHDPIYIETKILMAGGKKLQFSHELFNAAGEKAASCIQMMVHVDLKTRKACAPLSPVLENLAAL